MAINPPTSAATTASIAYISACPSASTIRLLFRSDTVECVHRAMLQNRTFHVDGRCTSHLRQYRNNWIRDCATVTTPNAYSEPQRPSLTWTGTGGRSPELTQSSNGGTSRPVT